MAILSQLDAGTLQLVQVSLPSAERDGHGVMIGVLVCRDAAGNEVILKAISGNSLTIVPHHEAADETAVQHSLPSAASAATPPNIWVPPLASPDAVARALEKNDGRIHALTAALKHATIDRRRRKITAERSALTAESLARVHELYRFHTISGAVKTIREICTARLPPTGTGDCCAPKLLDYAFSHGLHPISMDEVYYGRNARHRQSGISYPPCDERCGIVLPVMLGLEIIYRDDDIVVINKPSGLLSVPGRGPDKQDCAVTRLKRLFPACIDQPSVHRLDMETSGLLVLAFTAAAHRHLSRQFQNGTVLKQYVALLDGSLAQATGRSRPAPGQTVGNMTLYFRLDVENRPHQIWDAVHGKKAITEWERLGFQRYCGTDGKMRTVTRMLFTPRTGRTHQLRLAASDSHGFGIPIVGDALYGQCSPGERLCLHAERLAFVHPTTQEHMEFRCPAPF